MFANTFQSGCLSILYSVGSKPLHIWATCVRDGYVKRITDNDLQSLVIEICSTNVSTTYISTPRCAKTSLAIKLPHFSMIVKNLNKYFTFEITIVDSKDIRRRFKASTFQRCTKVSEFICNIPMRLDPGWNKLQFDLCDLTRRAYGTRYIETYNIKIHANCRLRRIYFTDINYTEDQLPLDFRTPERLLQRNI
ncbi:hypothetical protein SNEBB_010379 [Seison nebaliae]|nr:hypothetical protein SNEBB_010379 [Seison nebaliae]